MATIAIIRSIKNKTGFMLALLFILFIGAGAVMAKTLTDGKKDKVSTEKKNKDATPKNHKQTSYYWYQKNSAGNYVFDHQGTEPTSGCPALGSAYCAKGFSLSQSGTIIDTTPAAANRYYDN